jgi:hypothetical protein
VHEARGDLPKQVKPVGAVPLQGRSAVGADPMIEPRDEDLAGSGGFIGQARVRPTAAPVSSIKLIPERASASAQVAAAIHNQHYDAHSRWGLNE